MVPIAEVELANVVAISRMISKASRISTIKMTSAAAVSHVGSSLSVVDILSSTFSLYSYQNKIDFLDLILSKGHAAAALYAVLDSLNFLDASLENYCKDGSTIYGHINHKASKKIPLSTGSLGHGLPFGLGMAMASKIKKVEKRIVVVISDGELNEGTTWESALLASHHNLKNLTVIIDRNRIQSLGHTEQILKLDPLPPKWQSFGWDVVEIDGHDHKSIIQALLKDPEKPLCVIANTVKGKGVSFMENELKWHYKYASPEEVELAIGEIEKSDT